MELVEAGKLADEYFQARQNRLDAAKAVAKLEEHEKQLKNDLIEALKEAGIPTVGGALCTVKHVVKEKPVATNWEEVYDYIVQFEAFDLLQKRLGERAIKERWEDGEEIPGIGVFEVDDLSVSKAK